MHRPIALCFALHVPWRCFLEYFFNDVTTFKLLILPAAATVTTTGLWTPIKAVECNNINEVLTMMAMIRVITSKPLLCSLVAEEYIFVMELISVGAAHSVIEVWRIICIKYGKIMYKAGIWITTQGFIAFWLPIKTVLLLVNDCDWLLLL